MIDALPTAWDQLMFGVRLLLVLWAVVGAVLAALPPASAYVAEGKWPKPVWIGLCAATALAIWFTGFGILALLGIVAVGVFFADVRPAVGGLRR